MTEKKTILFITHNTNSYDHYLPLIVNLKKDKNIDVKVLAFYHKYTILRNKLHNYITQENKIDIQSMTNFCYFSFLHILIIKLYKSMFLSDKNKKSNFKKLRVVKKILEKYFVICSVFLLSNKKIKKYIELNNVSLLVNDHRVVNNSLIDLKPIISIKEIIKGRRDPINYSLFRFAKRCREKNIPIFMIPHGPQPILKKILSKKYSLIKDSFNPDYFVVVKKDEIALNFKIHGLKQTLILGDPRFDINWINYLESCALKVYGHLLRKPKDKKVILYLMDGFTFTSVNNKKYKDELNKDVLSLVNHFPNVEIWVKHHPRNVYDIKLHDFINKDRENNIKQFGNDFDSNILLAKCDICLSAASTVLIAPILQKKPVIFYDRWKEKHKADSIYDGVPCEASSKEKLVNQVKKILEKGYKIDDIFLKKFYKSVFSQDQLYEEMVVKYSRKIKEIIDLKNN